MYKADGREGLAVAYILDYVEYITYAYIYRTVSGDRYFRIL